MNTSKMVYGLALAAAWLVSGTAQANAAVDYFAGNDFSISHGNPNGVWSYGWQADGGSGCTLFQNTVAGTYAMWTANGYSGPYIGNDQNWSQMLDFVRNGGQLPVLRWTAPEHATGAAVYVSAQFTYEETQMQVFVNGQYAGAAANWKYLQYDFDQYLGGLKQGDTIDFVLNSSGFSQLTADIRVSAVPEPATYLAGLSVLGMWVAARRRR